MPAPAERETLPSARQSGFSLRTFQKMRRFSLAFSSRAGTHLHRAGNRHPPCRSLHYALREGRFLFDRQQPSSRLCLTLGPTPWRPLVPSCISIRIPGEKIFGLSRKITISMASFAGPAEASPFPPEDAAACLPFCAESSNLDRSGLSPAAIARDFRKTGSEHNPANAQSHDQTSGRKHRPPRAGHLALVLTKTFANPNFLKRKRPHGWECPPRLLPFFPPAHRSFLPPIRQRTAHC